MDITKRIGIWLTMFCLVSLTGCSVESKVYYNPEGDEIEYVLVEEDGCTLRYEFDEAGYMTKQMEYYYGSDDDGVETVYEYDAQHRNIAITRYSIKENEIEGTVAETRKQYNEKGQLIYVNEKDGHDEYSTEYTYDEKGNQIKKVKTDEEPTSKEVYEYNNEYNADGLKVKTLWSHRNRKYEEDKDYEIIYEYNKDNYLSEETEYIIDGKNKIKGASTSYTYNKKGKLIREEYECYADYEQGTNSYITEYKYDRNGNLKEKATLWPGVDFSDHDYQYKKVSD